MVAWATEVEEFSAGPRDVLYPELGLADFGSSEFVLGEATGDEFDIVSLGDGGSITLTFAEGFGDGPGDDFAVWENGFYSIGGLFAEFAFVEVSTNGVDFARFEPTTTNGLEVDSLYTVDPTDYHNLAGDQPIGLGTGFDLSDLRTDPLFVSGGLDLYDVHFVRVVDVIGDGSTFDGLAQPVYDPYPTPFASGGFDLEAVGVIYETPEPSLGATLLGGVCVLAVFSHRRMRRSPCPRFR